MDVTGTAQHEAWSSRAVPPVEQLRPDLWSIPVPMGGPLRYVSAYAFALDGGGLGLIDTGWESDEGWRALTGGLASSGGGIGDVRGVLVTHLHFDHLGLAARVREASGAWVAMHPADVEVVRRLSTADAQAAVDAFRHECNTDHPHQSLDMHVPADRVHCRTGRSRHVVAAAKCAARSCRCG